MKKNTKIKLILILALVCVTFYAGFLIFAWSLEGTAEEDPSGYKIYVSQGNTAEETVIIVNCNEVINGWDERMSEEEYSTLKKVMDVASWVKTEDDLKKDINHANIRISLYEPIANSTEQKQKSYGLYADSTAVIYETKDENEPGLMEQSCYQLPAGAYDTILSYLQSDYKEKIDETSDLERLFLEILSGDYSLSWVHFYKEPIYRDQTEIFSDSMICFGNDALTKDLEEIFKDTSSWEKTAVDLNAQSTNPSLIITGNFSNMEIQIQIDEDEAGNSRILIGQYSMYTAPGGIAERIISILERHEDLWMVDVLE